MKPATAQIILRLLMDVYWQLNKVPGQKPGDLPLLAEAQQHLKALRLEEDAALDAAKEKP